MQTNNQAQHIELDSIQWIIMTFIFYFIFIVLQYIVHVIWNLIKWTLPNTNLLKKYSNGKKECWAVVTGATDGIGLGFCQELVSLGFDVCLVSRNQQKINQTIVKLQAQKPQQFKQKKIKGIQFDFTNMQDFKQYSRLIQQLDQLEIGMLVNNVGISYIKAHQQISYKQIVDVISVNCLSMSMLNHYLLKRCMQCSPKPCLVNLSSLSGLSSIPYISLYSSTKAFNNFLSVSLSMQHPSLDILSVQPMLVVSAGSKAVKGFNVPTSRECARDSLNQLTFKQKQTKGYIMHRITGQAVINLLPNWLLRIVSKKEMINLINTYKYDKRDDKQKIN